MDILITGRLKSITGAVGEQLIQRHKVAFASDDVVPEQLGGVGTPFQISPGDKDFEKIFHSYHFRVVIFLSQIPYGEQEYYQEYEDLENCLRLCAAHDVNQFLYLQPKRSEAETRVPESDLDVLFSACEQLCDYYRQRRAMSVIVCSVPSLYGYGETSSIIGDAVYQAQSRASIQFRGAKEQRCGFLSQKDLGELLLRMVENWSSGYDRLDIPPADVMTFQELGGLFHAQYPTARLSYQPGSFTLGTLFSDKAVKEEYDWIPVMDLQTQLPDVIHSVSETPAERKKTLLSRIKDLFKKHSFVVKIIELVLGFILMEFLNRITGTTIQFQYIDFRLLYIVLMGTLHGMKIGLSAAGLASVSLLATSITNHNNWSAVIYDIDTWLPFIFFFLIGAVTGYVKDRLRSDNKFLSEEKDILENKYILLNEFYVSALRNKDSYKNQIMSYRNSFGRLFDITKNLNSTLVDEVFSEALYALEGILDNRSVCIYSCDPNMLFGRLIVCSKEIRDITDKTLKLSNLEKMTGQFQDGEVWVNRDRLLAYPEYAVPIYHEGHVIALITLQKASYEQMAIYYENLVKIICGLIKISLVRALEFTEKIEDEIYLPGSRIVKNSYFGQIVSVKEQMAQNGVSEYVLIHFETTPQNQAEIANRISKLIRTTDVLGLGKDGQLYLCLTQTNQSNIHFVLERIQAAGLLFHELESGESV